VITLDGIRDKENAYSLIHPTAYYTLNNIPEGKKLALAELSTINTAKTVAKVSGVPGKPLTFNQVKPLLTQYTCISCHDPNKKQVGPSFSDIAKRKYSAEKMLQLIYNPQPQNWPGFAVSMPPMNQVPRADARKIVAWIKSLEK
jgi:cytochrome c551/c552